MYPVNLLFFLKISGCCQLAILVGVTAEEEERREDLFCSRGALTLWFTLRAISGFHDAEMKAP